MITDCKGNGSAIETAFAFSIILIVMTKESDQSSIILSSEVLKNEKTSRQITSQVVWCHEIYLCKK